jgi:hypothetical protein
MPCGICGKWRHNTATCPHNTKHKRMVQATKKGKRCQCCGQYGNAVQEHHIGSPSEDKDNLAICFDCHLECCHSGDFHNIGNRPRVCQIMNRDSFWNWDKANKNT